MLRDLIEQNLSLLTQAQEILTLLPEALYRLSNDATYGASPGAHIRHILQYYDALLSGLSGGVINYDTRNRSSPIETNLAEALAASDKIFAALAALPNDDRAVQTIQNQNPRECAPPEASSLRRELAFLISHTVHHFALVAVALRINGVAVPRYFGYAPATIHYLEKRYA